MTILLTGATGMVGEGTLLEALDHPEVSRVISLGRRSTGREHPKLKEIVHSDFLEYDTIADELAGVDACLWCLGISVVGLSDSDYRRITHDFTIAAAEALHAANPAARFCYVSGAGTDESEEGRLMWARVKGETENDLKRVGLAGVHLFRPGLIRPMREIKPRDRLQKIAYPFLAPIMPLLVRWNLSTTTIAVGRALIAAGMGRVEQEVLGNREINEVAEREEA